MIECTCPNVCMCVFLCECVPQCASVTFYESAHELANSINIMKIRGVLPMEKIVGIQWFVPLAQKVNTYSVGKTHFVAVFADHQ